jgi:hypothetical protein
MDGENIEHNRNIDPARPPRYTSRPGAAAVQTGAARPHIRTVTATPTAMQDETPR